MKFFTHICLYAFFFLVIPSQIYGVEDNGALLEKIQFVDGAVDESIRVQLSGRVIPDIFMLGGKNPRLVIDFLETKSSIGVPGKLDVAGDLIQRIRMGMHLQPQQKTRVVVDLIPGKNYSYSQTYLDDEQAILVTLFVSIEDLGKTESVNKKVSLAEPAEVVKPEAEKPIEGHDTEKEKKEIVQEIALNKTAPPVTLSREKNKIKQISDSDKLVAQPEASPMSPEAELLDVAFENSSNKGEMVLFKLNGFYPPIVFGIEKGDPRVVCDFLDTTLSEKVVNIIPSNGKYVKTIRVATHSNQKVRVVINLVSNRNYDLQQVFFKEDNLFVLIVNTLEDSEQNKIDN